MSLPSPGSGNSVSLICGQSIQQTYTVTVTGTSGPLSHTATISFINQPAGGGCISSNCPKHS
jgi:hypothetical protein